MPVLKIDRPFNLYVLLPHFGPPVGPLENHCFQILKYLRRTKEQISREHHVV